MNPAELSRLAESLMDIASLFERLGLPGFVLLVLAGPALVLCVIVFVEYHRSRRNQEMADSARTEGRAMLETYRADTQQILRELGAGIDQTARFYRENVELAKQYERIAKGLQDVVVSNTRAMERLITMIESQR